MVCCQLWINDKIGKFLMLMLVLRNLDYVRATYRVFVFARCEDELFMQMEDSFAGSTALVAVVDDRMMHIANLGDCRAVLCKDGQAVQVISAMNVCVRLNLVPSISCILGMNLVARSN